MDREEVRETILRDRPGWRVSSIRDLGEGDFCRAYLVNEEWVFRFDKHEAAYQSLAREFCMLPRLRDRVALSIPSPQVAGPHHAGGLRFLAHPLLPGPVLSQERYQDLDDSSRTRCATQVGVFLTQLHAVDLSHARACGIPVRDYSNHFTEVLSRARTGLYPLLEEPERGFIERVIGRYLGSGDAQRFRPALLHGDLSPAHVMFDERSESVSAVIDFGDLMIGDPAWDLVFIYEDYGLDFLSRLLPVYCKTDRDELVRRVYEHYLLAAIDWAVGARARGEAEFGEAREELRRLRRQEVRQRRELFFACGID